MITLDNPIQNGGDPAAPYTHAAVMKLTVNRKDDMFHFVVGFGGVVEGRMVFADLAIPKIFTVRKDRLRDDCGGDWELPEGYVETVLSAVGGPMITVLEQRLLAEGILEGTI